MPVKTVNEKPYHPPESTGNIFPVHPPLRTIKAWFPYGLCGSLRVAEDRTVLGKTVKDRERPNGNTTERSAKTVSDPQIPTKTESLRVVEIETSSIPATLKDP